MWRRDRRSREGSGLQAIFRRTGLHQLAAVEEALGGQALALLKQLEAATQAADELAEATRASSNSTQTPPSSPAFPAWASFRGASASRDR